MCAVACEWYAAVVVLTLLMCAVVCEWYAAVVVLTLLICALVWCACVM